MTSTLEEGAQMSLLEEAGLWCFRLADGDLSDEQQAAFEDWLMQSGEHRQAFEDTVRTWHGVDEISRQPDMISARADALESFNAANRRRWTGRFRASRTLAALAASLILMLASFAIYSHYAFEAYVTGTGERRVVVLDDGSRISLDADTQVRVRYRNDRRELELVHGRAKFDVAKNSLRPFTVAAANRIVIATGTEFSVELLGRKVHVILYEGRVAVLGDRGGASELSSAQRRMETNLTPGSELVADITTEQMQILPTDAGQTLSWEAGLLAFEDEPLQSAVERMNRYSVQKLAVGNPAAARTPISGVYTAGNAAAFVEGVTSVSPLRIEDRAGVKTFVR